MRVPCDRIAVVRPRPGLGDLLCSVPALRALREACPNATITLIGLEHNRWFVERFANYVDELIAFPGWPGVPGVPFDARRALEFFEEAHATDYDLAIQLYGDGMHTNSFTGMLGARHTAGAHLAAQPSPDPDFYIEYPLDLPEPERALRVVEHIGARGSRGAELEFPLEDAEAPDLEAGKYVCLHAGARKPERRWPAEHFAAVADTLTERGFEVVLTGLEDEREVTAEVAGHMEHDARDAAGTTDVGALAALVRNASAVVCNDTGVSHLAAALDVPSVVVFGPDDDVQRWAPADRERHRCVGGDGEPVTVDEVLEAYERLPAAPAPLVA